MKLTQNLTLPGGTTLDNPIKDPKLSTVGGIVSQLITYIFVIAGIGLLVVILSSGFTLLTSAGDAKAMEKGKKGLTNGIIGFVIIFVAYWLVQITGIVFGIPEIKELFK